MVDHFEALLVLPQHFPRVGLGVQSWIRRARGMGFGGSRQSWGRSVNLLEFHLLPRMRDPMCQLLKSSQGYDSE